MRKAKVRGKYGKPQLIEIQPTQKFVFGIYFAIAALGCLTCLEAVYLAILRMFSSEIFAAISLTIGTIIGAVFGQKAS